jgi:hypothetical protein
MHCPCSGTCTVPVPVPALQVIRYSKSSGTRRFYSQPVPAHSHHRYPCSMSSGTHTPCHPVLSSSGTNTALIRYSKSSGTRRFYKSSGTHTPCHPVLSSCSGTFTVPVLVPLMFLFRYHHSHSVPTHSTIILYQL